MSSIKFINGSLRYDNNKSNLYTHLHKRQIGISIAENFNRQTSGNYFELAICKSDTERVFKIDCLIDSINQKKHLDIFNLKKSTSIFKTKIFLFFLIVMSSIVLYIMFHYAKELGLIQLQDSNTFSYYNFVMYFLSLGQSGFEPANSYTQSILLLSWIPFLFTFSLLFTNFNEFINVRFDSVSFEINRFFLHHKDLLVQLRFDIEHDLIKERIEDWKLKLHAETDSNASLMLIKLENG